MTQVLIQLMPCDFYNVESDGKTIVMVSTFMGVPPVARDIVEVKNVAELKTKVDAMINLHKDRAFTTYLRCIGRNLNGFDKAKRSLSISNQPAV